MQIAVDADILLRMVSKTNSNPKKSLQEGHTALDMAVQNGIYNILKTLKETYQIKILVVLDGLTPLILQDKDQFLKKSQKIWGDLDINKSQNEMNATKQAKCNFFIAPYLSSAQIGYFLKKQLIHAGCGSSIILLYDVEQIILDLDLNKGKFYFVDRTNSISETMADFFILKGGLYNEQFPEFQNKKMIDLVQEIKKHIQEEEKDSQASSKKKREFGEILLRRFVKNNQEYLVQKFLQLKFFVVKFPPILTIERKLGNLKRDSQPDFLYNSEELDEFIANQQIMGTILMAPGILFNYAWKSPEYKNLFFLTLKNFHQVGEKENAGLNKKLKELYSESEFKFDLNEHFHYKWQFTEDEIKNEVDRQNQDVSLVFTLKFIQYLQDNKAELFKQKTNFQDIQSLPKLKTENQILLMCYLQYLEERKYFELANQYEYGKYLNIAQPYEEEVLIFLEMLKIFFPAGLNLPVIDKFQNESRKYDYMALCKPQSEEDQQSILLLTRLFSLMPLQSEALEKGQQIEFKIDYDICQFNTYVNQLKHLIRSYFQSIMYRLFLNQRADPDFYSSVSDKMIFKKKSNFLQGLIMKSLLLRTSLDEPYPNFNGSIEKEFNFFTREELLKSLERGCHFFKRILLVKSLISNKPKPLDEHFEKGKEFLVAKFEQLKLRELASIFETDQ